MKAHRHGDWTRWLARLAAPLALWAWASAAGAALVTLTDSDAFSNEAGAQRTLSLDRFDASLGTLLKVGLQVSVSGEGSARQQFSCPGDPNAILQLCTFSVAFGRLDLDLSHSQGLLQLALHGSDSGRINCNVRRGDTATCGDDLAVAVQQSAEATDALTLDLFDNPGFVELKFFKSAFDLFRSTMSGSATITYTYDDGRSASVAEPGTLSATSLALLALVGTARSRRRHLSAREKTLR